jgi:hypothetical protein
MITFVAAAYKEKYDPYLFISAMLLQTDPRWKCLIYCDQPNTYVNKAVRHFKDDRITVVSNKKPKGFWGHYNRKHALEELVDTEFIIQASIQDYYIPITVQEILENFNNKDLVFFNCIHNHKTVYSDHKSYSRVQDTILLARRIDWSSYAVRTNIAKKIGINNPESDICDGIFAEECARKIPPERIMKIHKPLVVHN